MASRWATEAHATTNILHNFNDVALFYVHLSLSKQEAIDHYPIQTESLTSCL